MTHTRRFLALAAAASFIVSACSGGGTASTAPSAAPSGAAALDEVRLQLQWVPQAQFAGYFAAVEQGFYEANGIKLTIVDGGPDVVPQQAGSAANGPEFTISWVPKVLEAREGTPASDLVDIAQIFQRSGTLSVSWKDSSITSPADFKGKKVGVWDFGNEFEVTAGAKKAGLEQGTDYEKVIQPFDMTLLLSRQIDVAEAMIYNEYAQVLETINPATGELYQPEDMNIIDYNEVGSAMLQDAVWASAAWLAESGNEDVAVRFLEASFRGWIYCRDNFEACVDIVLANGPALPAGHQTWQLNEINALIWPSPVGIGIMDQGLWDQTVEIATAQGIIAAAPGADAFRTDLTQQALDRLTANGEDVTGEGYAKQVIELTEGGA
jgi:NitT/TauT family transport system substrate-binding protein